MKATYINGFIYIMHIPDTYRYKIGLSKNPKQREKQLQRKLGTELQLLHYRRVFFTHYFEQFLHRLVSRKNVTFDKAGKEWFEFYNPRFPILLVNLMAFFSSFIVFVMLTGSVVAIILLIGLFLF